MLSVRRAAALRRQLQSTRRTIVSSTRQTPVQRSPRQSLSSAIVPRVQRTAFPSSLRHFSTNAATTLKPAPVRDFFLDNLGKIFLGIIATIIASLVRSSYGTSNMQAQVRKLEEASALDPLEIDELRKANVEFTPELFRIIVKGLTTSGGNLTYQDFVNQVRTIMRREKGNHVTIGLGYLLDRIVISALQTGRQKKEESTEESSLSSDLTMPLTFWMTVLSLAMNGPVSERIRILYELLEQQNAISLQAEAKTPIVTLGNVITMVGYLQETSQLVPDKQVIPTSNKYPTQQYRRGEPDELVRWGEAAAAATGANQEEVLDIDAFADILRSKSVCAWGECYRKKKYVS